MSEMSIASLKILGFQLETDRHSPIGNPCREYSIWSINTGEDTLESSGFNLRAGPQFC